MAPSLSLFRRVLGHILVPHYWGPVPTLLTSQQLFFHALMLLLPLSNHLPARQLENREELQHLLEKLG